MNRGSMQALNSPMTFETLAAAAFYCSVKNPMTDGQVDHFNLPVGEEEEGEASEPEAESPLDQISHQ